VITKNLLNLKNESFKENFIISKTDFYDLYYKFSFKFNLDKRSDLTKIDYLMITLLNLRFYLPYLIIATLYGVSKSTISKIINETNNCLYHILEKSIVFSNNERINKSKTLFQNYFVSTIIDGSEQPVKVSNDIYNEERFYSAKKGFHSIIKIIGINPNYEIIFSSNSHYGSTDEKWIVRNEFPNLMQNERILGDKGFQGVEKILACDPFSRFGRSMSSLRIKVENVFALVKKFSCCNDKLRFNPENDSKLLELHDKYWTIVIGLINNYISKNYNE